MLVEELLGSLFVLLLGKCGNPLKIQLDETDEMADWVKVLAT